MIDGFINIYKTAGLTSHDVVSQARRILCTRAVGHMGTLDPDAEGVLPLAVGKATRLIGFVEGDTKEYRAELYLGLSTDTWDTTGTRIAEVDACVVTEEMLRLALPKFTGALMQVPPMYSAIKIQGKKLYELARQGLEVPREPRPIVVHDLLLLAWREEGNLRVATLQVMCSKGTYIRALCKDIGDYLGLPASMGKLVRTASGPFQMGSSVTLAQLAENPRAHVTPMGEFLHAFPRMQVSSEEARRFVSGQRFRMDNVPLGEFGVYCGEQLLGLAYNLDGHLAPTRVLTQEVDTTCV